MKIISWNVNGIRSVQSKGFAETLARLDADCILLPETKVQADQIDKALDGIDNYHIYSNCAERKGYSGFISTRIPRSGHEQIMHEHRAALANCSRCPTMTGSPVLSPILLVGQAPGDKEGGYGKPFAWTAGKPLFKWFERIGLDEETFRQRVYMAAVCRCFPGKNPKSSDRVPSPAEIDNCAGWLQAEIDLLKPKLILPVGKLAISQLMPVKN